MDEFTEFLIKLGKSVARGVPQVATGFIDLAGLPLTLTGYQRDEDIVGSTAYLTKKGLLYPPQKGLLNETTELISSAVSPAGLAKTTAGLLALGMIPVVKKQIDNIPVASAMTQEESVAKAATDEVAQSPKDMLIVHKTDEDKLRDADYLGGFASPSLAVVRENVPLLGFGDISLIGDPKQFDPKMRNNPFYSSDAYTPRAPRSYRVPKKDAWKKFKERYGHEDSNYLGSELENKATKSKAHSGLEDDVERFLLSSKTFKESGKSLSNEMDDLFGETRYFEYENPNYERNMEILNKRLETASPRESEAIYLQMERLERNRYKVKPYELGKVANVMKKMPQVGGEFGMGSKGVGRLKAALTQRFKNFDQMKQKRGEIQDVGAIKEEFKDRYYEQLGKIARRIEGNTFEGMDSIADFMFDAVKQGGDLRDAMRRLSKKEYYESYKITDDDIDQMVTLVNDLKEAPVGYFEGKPTRPVEFSEFAGAIVPENTSDEVIGLLQDRGIKRIEKMPRGAENDLAKRKAFRDLMFSAGGAGLLGYGLYDNEEPLNYYVQ